MSIINNASSVKINQIAKLISVLHDPLWGFGGDVGSEIYLNELIYQNKRGGLNLFTKVILIKKYIATLTICHVFVAQVSFTNTFINSDIVTMMNELMLGTFRRFSFCHFTASPPMFFWDILMNCKFHKLLSTAWYNMKLLYQTNVNVMIDRHLIYLCIKLMIWCHLNDQHNRNHHNFGFQGHRFDNKLLVQ